MIESQSVKNKVSSPIEFVKQSFTELKKVVWPTRKQLIRLTLIVISVSLATGLLISGLDYIFTQIIGVILK